MWEAFGKHGVGYVEADFFPGEGPPVAARILYPADKPAPGSGSVLDAWLPWRWRGVRWLPHVNYARGLAAFFFFRLKGPLYDALKQVLVAVAWAAGKSQKMDLAPGAPLAADAPPQLPLVLFSHGIGGNRFLYSIICAELASQGYVVVAVEHADGTAAVARLPGGKWLYYAGLGDEAAQAAKSRVRVAEMKSALRLMQALHRGDNAPGLTLSPRRHPASFLRGRLDMRCVAAAGHSYGGATITALAAEDPRFHCAVALDPWWPALPPESPALSRFATRAPLLVLGSHDWNVPNAFGHLACGAERQELVLSAAAPRRDAQGGHSGGGAMLLSIAGSSHNTFADALPLFGEKVGWLLERLGLTARLDPVLGVHLCATATLNFLSLHLPLTAEQRAAQSWQPASGHSALDRIRQRDAADRGEGRRGPLAWLFPGRGLINAASDFLLDRVLPNPAAFRQAPASARPPSPEEIEAAEKEAAANGAAANGHGGGAAEPADVATGAEVAEAALPSADPASGAHPHAPSAAARRPGAARPGAAGAALAPARSAELRARLNTRYSAAVGEEEVEEVRALLGGEHIFIARVAA